jgi:pyridoxal phosphate enzyme (YggS family)
METQDLITRWRHLRESLPAGVTLVVVSKRESPESIEVLYRAGQRVFGENRVQELVEKQALLPADIEWHLIGHLQTNKVRQFAPFVTMINGVESARLLEAIDREGERAGRVIPCLLQFHVAAEETKFGMDLPTARALLDSERLARLRHVRVAGVMGMATFTSDEARVRADFDRLRVIFDTLARDYFPGDDAFKELSMGMSGDYPLAIASGSTMIRVGSAIFRPE